MPRPGLKCLIVVFVSDCRRPENRSILFKFDVLISSQFYSMVERSDEDIQTDNGFKRLHVFDCFAH